MKNQNLKKQQKSKAAWALILGLMLALCLCLAGCGNQGSSEPSAAGSGSASAAEESSAAPQKAVLPEGVTLKDYASRFYTGGTLGKWTTIPTYSVEGEEDVPYISARQFISLIYDNVDYTWENEVLTVTRNGSNAMIDTVGGTITFEDSAAFIGPNTEGAVGHGIVEAEEFNQIRVSDKNKSTETEGKSCEIDLNAYQLKTFAYGDDVLMPFLGLQNTFALINGQNDYSYNGKDYYDVDSVADEIMSYNEKKTHVPYIERYYSGPFSKKDTCSQAYANYAYYTTCLLLDMTYGHKEELGVENFDAFLTKLKAKDSMTSTNPADVMAVETMLIFYLFDSGHDAMSLMQGVYGRDTDMKAADGVEESIQVPEDPKADETADFLSQVLESLGDSEATNSIIDEKNGLPSVTGLYAWSLFMESTKPKDYGRLRLDYSGDTAVIYFEHFMDDVLNKYYVHTPTKEDEAKSSFAFFYRCFKDIKKHDNVKNVVINLANNGGGYAAGLVSILGFMSPDGEVLITSRDMTSEKYREEYYHVDTNLDGVFDDKDGFGGKYDFYILTSGSAYSCGTALPFYAQQQGLAKIMGTKPGGGDCCLATFLDAFGMSGAISGNMTLGVMTDKGFISDEKAVKPDIKMMDSIIEVPFVPWYDADGIAKKVRSSKKKAKN